MNKHIPESYHSLKIPQLPGDGGITSGYAPDGFSNDLEMAFNGGPDYRVITVIL